MPYTSAQLTAYYTALTGVAPDAATSIAFQAYANQDAAGTLSDSQTLLNVFNSVGVQNTFEVAESTYQFFTGATTTAAGLTYLEGVNTTTTNSNGLTTSYYNGTGGSISSPSTTNGFNTENRYYNFAINLASAAGAGNTSFSASYGGLTVTQTISAAYEAIVGSSNVGTANANAAIADINSRISYFQQVAATRGGDATALSNPNSSLTLKAVIVGYILEEANKADVGTYAKAIDQFEASVAAGNGIYNTNLLSTYQAGGAGYNTGVGLSTAAGSSGTTLAFTTATDVFNPTTGNVTFVGQAGAGIGGGATLNASDTVNAGGSNNTLISNTIGAVDASGGAILNGIQTVDVRVTDGSNVTLSQSAVPQATTLNSYLATGQVTFNNVNSNTTVGIVGNGSAQGGSIVANYAASAPTATVALTGGTLSSTLAGAGAATNVTVNGASATTLNLTSANGQNSINTLTDATATTANINASSPLIITTSTLGALQTLNVSGSGAVNLDFGGGLLSNTITTVNALSATGGLSARFDTSGASPLTVTTGSGADSIQLNNANANTVVNTSGGGDIITVTGNVTAGATLNGGGGARLSVTAAAYGNATTAAAATTGIESFTSAQRSQITGFNTVNLTTAATANLYDLNVIGAQNLRLSNGITAGVTATVYTPATTTITFNGNTATSGILNVVENNALTNATDTATVNFINQASGSAGTYNLTTQGVETVTFSSTLATGAMTASTTTVNLYDLVAQTLNFGGVDNYVFAAAGATNAGATANANGSAPFSQLSTVNVTTSGTANIDLSTINTTGTTPLTVNTGSGAATVAVHDLTTVNGGSGLVTLIVAQSSNGASPSTLNNVLVGDQITFEATPITTQTGPGGAAASGSFTAVAANATTGNITPIVLTSVAAYRDYLNAAIGGSAAGQITDFVYQGNTYVVEHSNTTASTFQDGIDSVVKLVGIHTISNATTATAGGLNAVTVTS